MQPSRAAISSYHLKGSHWFLSNTCYIVDKIRVSHVNKISNHSTSLFHELQLCFICQKVSEKVRDNCRTWIARATFSALKHWRIWIGNINGKTLKAESSLSYVSNNQKRIKDFNLMDPIFLFLSLIHCTFKIMGSKCNIYWNFGDLLPTQTHTYIYI